MNRFPDEGQLIDFRLTATRSAKAARAFLQQAKETVRLYQPMTIVTDKAPTYAKVIREMNQGCDPADQIRHVDRKHLNNRIESDHAALKRLLGRNQSFRSIRSAKATLQGIETIRTIKKSQFENCKQGVQNEITFIQNLFVSAA